VDLLHEDSQEDESSEEGDGEARPKRPIQVSTRTEDSTSRKMKEDDDGQLCPRAGGSTTRETLTMRLLTITDYY
jgi:hypothetical protein